MNDRTTIELNAAEYEVRVKRDGEHAAVQVFLKGQPASHRYSVDYETADAFLHQEGYDPVEELRDSAIREVKIRLGIGD